MDSEKKRKLTDLGPEALADALLELTGRTDAADDLVERLIATPVENTQRYKAKLADLKRGHGFISWKESATFARELKLLLEDLKSGIDDPQAAVELLASFYEADVAVFEQCDDSNGNVGDVFRYDAKELFLFYAVRCQDKQWLSGLVFDLYREDDYGVRDVLVDCAGEYLPESEIRNLIERFQAAADGQTGEYGKRHWLLAIESLARQLKDAPLFEKTRLASWRTLNAAAHVDIARVYLDSGDAQKALAWLKQVPAEETFEAAERDQLLLEIYGRRGETQEQAAVAWRLFKNHPSSQTLADLLAVIGQDQKDAVIEGEVAELLKALSLSDSAALFLVEMGRMDEVETYVLDRANQLNGEFYYELLPLAEAMEAHGRWLCASIIYRALLDSILNRAQTKAYAHGAGYLERLDNLAKSVSDWRGLEEHEAYLRNLRQQHGRKWSFWAQFER